MPAITPEQLAEQLAKALGENLISVTLYGPASQEAQPELPEGTEYPLLIVTASLDFAALKAMAASIRDWRKQGQPRPLVFTQKRLEQSGNSFSVELLDMKEARRVLYGKDSILYLEVSRIHFQQELATNLKRELLTLRSQFLDCLGESDLLLEALLESQFNLRLLVRAALRLYMPVGPTEHHAVLKALTVHMPVKTEIFLQVEALKKNKDPSDLESLYVQYLEELEKIIDATDRLLRNRSEPLTAPPFKK